jgi:hypothetical protein
MEIGGGHHVLGLFITKQHRILSFVRAAELGKWAGAILIHHHTGYDWA